jgi:hypothetical protein
MSGLFWWSAEMISMRRPSIEKPNSSAAMRAASTDPRPVALESGPFMSVMTPTFMVSSEICAYAGPVMPAAMEIIRYSACGSLETDMTNSFLGF